jgi:hypothetical protein
MEVVRSTILNRQQTFSSFVYTFFIPCLYLFYVFYAQRRPLLFTASSEVVRRTFGIFALKGFLLQMVIIAHMQGVARVIVISVMLLNKLE